MLDCSLILTSANLRPRKPNILGSLCKQKKNTETDLDKVKSICKWQEPKIVKEVRGFLEFA